MTNDKIATILGGILAAITAIQPIVAAIDGKFSIQDVGQIAIAALIAGLGYYINKVDKPKT